MRTKSAITIHDVAAAAGVSVTTVSRVLNDKDDVAPETSARVRAVIRELGYASSLAARSMRSRRSNLIGVIVPDMVQHSLLVLRGIHRTACAAGYDLLIYVSAARSFSILGNREQQQVALLNGSVTDGLIVVTPHASSYRTTFPLVAVDPQSEDANFASVLSTNFHGVETAMQYLLEFWGHRRIGFIGGRPDLHSSNRRREGYCHSLRNYGLSVDESLMRVGNFERNAARMCALELLRLEPSLSAIMAANDEMAFGVYEAAHDLNLRIPGDLSVIGFDNIPDAGLAEPPLTTVDQSIEGMGALATEVVIKLIAGEPLDQLVYKVPTRLVIRQSCRPLDSAGSVS